MYIKVTVIPKAKKALFEKISADHFKISVKEKAERNMANIAVCKVVAGYLKVNPKKVRIINGHHSQTKLLSILD